MFDIRLIASLNHPTFGQVVTDFLEAVCGAYVCCCARDDEHNYYPMTRNSIALAMVPDCWGGEKPSFAGEHAASLLASPPIMHLDLQKDVKLNLCRAYDKNIHI